MHIKARIYVSIIDKMPGLNPHKNHRNSEHIGIFSPSFRRVGSKSSRHGSKSATKSPIWGMSCLCHGFSNITMGGCRIFLIENLTGVRIPEWLVD